jgi:hypothetical protein
LLVVRLRAERKIETNSIYLRNIHKWRKFTSLSQPPPILPSPRHPLPATSIAEKQINQTRRATLFEASDVYLCKNFSKKVSLSSPRSLFSNNLFPRERKQTARDHSIVMMFGAADGFVRREET